ncbi:MAG: hypothetical protein KCHDKBKB_01548 [Elusimicrobia bacterium]|nr:hypothetical protein [Elusimicrobiota bacterium]
MRWTTASVFRSAVLRDDYSSEKFDFLFHVFRRNRNAVLYLYLCQFAVIKILTMVNEFYPSRV